MSFKRLFPSNGASFEVQVAAAVVEVDVATESVSAKEVESIGLNPPKDSAEALERIKCNLIFYRQNYVLGVWLFAVVSNVTTPLTFVALLAGGGSVACSSDTLLGELAIASKDKLVWNKTRVAGFDRRLVRNGLAATAAVGLAVSAYLGRAAPLVSNLVLGMMLTLAHAVMRPIDLKSTLSNLWKDVSKVQNREEAEAMMKKGVKGIQSWWKNRRPADPTPVVVSVKEDPSNPGGFASAAAQAQARARQAEAARGRARGDVVDTTARRKPPSRGDLPPGRRP